jgi:hypothetical protein
MVHLLPPNREDAKNKRVDMEPLQNDGEGEHKWAKGESMLLGNMHPINEKINPHNTSLSSYSRHFLDVLEWHQAE